jgi:hypothetical protein
MHFFGYLGPNYLNAYQREKYFRTQAVEKNKTNGLCQTHFFRSRY